MEDDTREALKNQIRFNEEKAKRAKKEENEYLKSIKPHEEPKPPMGDCDECAHTVPLASMCKRRTIAKPNRIQDPLTNTYAQLYANRNLNK